MSNHEEHAEALDETRARLREAGVTVTEEGRVKSISATLDEMAQDGGGIIDQETAISWSLRIQAAEEGVMGLSRDLVDWVNALHTLPTDEIPTDVAKMFADSQTARLADVVTRFIYGLSNNELTTALQPMAKAIYGKELPLDKPKDPA